MSVKEWLWKKLGIEGDAPLPNLKFFDGDMHLHFHFNINLLRDMRDKNGDVD